MPRHGPSQIEVTRQQLSSLRRRIFTRELRRSSRLADTAIEREQVARLRRSLYLLELKRPNGLARLARLAIERLVLCGCKSPAMKCLQRHELEAFARAVLDPCGPSSSDALMTFRRGGGDRLKRSAAYRLKDAILDAAYAVIERRPVERSGVHSDQ